MKEEDWRRRNGNDTIHVILCMTPSVFSALKRTKRAVQWAFTLCGFDALRTAGLVSRVKVKVSIELKWQFLHYYLALHLTGS